MAGLFRWRLEFLRVAGGWCPQIEYHMRDLCNRLGFVMETRAQDARADSANPVVSLNLYSRSDTFSVTLF